MKIRFICGQPPIDGQHFAKIVSGDKKITFFTKNCETKSDCIIFTVGRFDVIAPFDG